MKTTHAVLSLGLAASFLFAVRASADDAPTGAAPAGEKIKISLVGKAGERWAVENAMHMDISVMGMEQAMDMNQLIVTKIDSAAADGSFAMRTQIARVWGKMSNPMMGDIDFDSDQPAVKAEDGDQMAMVKEMMQKQFTAMVGKDVVVNMKADGSSKVDAGAGPGGQAAQPFTALGNLPDKPVGVGDSWDAETSQAMQGMNMKIKLKNTLKAFDADTATIESTGSMEMAMSGDVDKSNPQAAMMANMKAKASAIKSTIKISRKDGFPLSGDTDMNLDMSMGGGGDEKDPNAAMPAGLEMSIKSKMHQERKPAPPEKPAAEPAKDGPKDGAAPAQPAAPPKPDGK